MKDIKELIKAGRTDDVLRLVDENPEEYARKDVVGTILDLLKSKDEDVRKETAWLINKGFIEKVLGYNSNAFDPSMITKKHVESFLNGLKSEDGDVRKKTAWLMRFGFVEKVLKYNKEAFDKDVMKGILDLLKSENEDVRYLTAWLIKEGFIDKILEYNPKAFDKDVMKGILDLLKSEDGEVRISIASVINRGVLENVKKYSPDAFDPEMITKDHVESFLNGLKSDDWRVREGTVELIKEGFIDKILEYNPKAFDKDVMKDFLNVLKSENKWVRSTNTKLIIEGFIDKVLGYNSNAVDEEIVKGFFGLLKDENPEVRLAAASTFGKFVDDVRKYRDDLLDPSMITKEHVKSVLDVLKSEDEDVRKKTAELINKGFVEKVLKYNKELLKNMHECIPKPNEKTGEAVAKAIEDYIKAGGSWKKIKNRFIEELNVEERTKEKLKNYFGKDKSPNNLISFVVDADLLPKNVLERLLEKENKALHRKASVLRSAVRLIGEKQTIDALENGHKGVMEAVKAKIRGIIGEDLPPWHHEHFEGLLNSPDFIEDFVTFEERYPKDVKGILHNIVREYYKNGIKGLKDLKYSQLTIDPNLSHVLKDIDGLMAHAESIASSPWEQISVSVRNYLQHRNELDIDKEMEKVEEELKRLGFKKEDVLGKSANELVELAKKSKVKPNKLIGLTRGLDALLRWKTDGKKFDRFIDELMQTKEEYRDDLIEEWVKDLNVEDMRVTASNLHATMKKGNVTRAILGVLSGLRGGEGVDLMTAQVSHDLGETLLIGRFGNAGKGNCQRATRTGETNHALMSYIVSPSEHIIVFRDKRGKMIGFSLLHGVDTDKGFALILEDPYLNKGSHAQAVEASRMLADLIAKKTGIPVIYPYGKKDVSLKYKYPMTPTKMYLDHAGTLAQEHEGTVKGELIGLNPFVFKVRSAVKKAIEEAAKEFEGAGAMSIGIEPKNEEEFLKALEDIVKAKEESDKFMDNYIAEKVDEALKKYTYVGEHGPDIDEELFVDHLVKEIKKKLVVPKAEHVDEEHKFLPVELQKKVRKIRSERVMKALENARKVLMRNTLSVHRVMPKVLERVRKREKEFGV